MVDKTYKILLFNESTLLVKKTMSITERVKDYKIEMESLKINDKIDVKNKNVNNLSLVKKYVDVESEEELKEIANRIMKQYEKEKSIN